MSDRDYAEGFKDGQRELATLLRDCIPPLIRLGDYIGNSDTARGGLPAFDRCALLLRIHRAIERA